MRRSAALIVTAAMFCTVAAAQDKRITLAAPDALQDSGILDYILPRFSLKTGIRIERDTADPDVTLAPAPPGRPVFEGPDAVWHLSTSADDGEAQRFADWLAGAVGRDTIAAFAAEEGAKFAPVSKRKAETTEPLPEGNADRGARLALAECGRCHVVDDRNRMKGVGSTPSFGVLRTLADWKNRFSTFYVLNPHGAFTQIADVTEPFEENRPSTIIPIELTLEDIDAIVAFVARLEPADLGAPIQPN